MVETSTVSLPHSTFIPWRIPLPPLYGPPSDSSGGPNELWTKHKYHVGFVTSALPHVVKFKPNSKFPMTTEYKLRQKAIAAIEGVIQSLLDQDVLVEMRSPCNTPIHPVPKQM